MAKKKGGLIDLDALANVSGLTNLTALIAADEEEDKDDD